MQASNNKPLTIREIQANKKIKRQAEQKKIRIKNVSSCQPITIQLYGKKSKNATDQLSIFIAPGKSVDLPESRVMFHQINNLKKRGLIRTSKVGIRDKKMIESNKETKVVKKKNIKKSKPEKNSKKNKTKEK